MERPALQRLLADIRADRADVVVVYKVDRLTRSLADFAKPAGPFDAQSGSRRLIAHLPKVCGSVDTPMQKADLEVAMCTNRTYYISLDDDHERNRIRRILGEQGLASFMNDTKWRALCESIHQLPFRPAYQVKVLGMEPEPDLQYAPEHEHNWATDPESMLGLHIEWMKIAPRLKIVIQRGHLLDPVIRIVDVTSELIALFKKLRLPFVEQDGFIILYGHGKGIEFDI
jgi:hypothetical protein